jgi:hypothetical protein
MKSNAKHFDRYIVKWAATFCLRSRQRLLLLLSSSSFCHRFSFFHGASILGPVVNPIIIVIIIILLLLLYYYFLCSTFALQLKTVLLDVLQLLMLSAGTLMSLEVIKFLLNTFYCKQN